MPDETKNVTTVFRVDVSDFKKNLASANSAIKLSKAQFEATTASMDDWSKSSDGLEAKLEQLEDTLQAQNKIWDTYKAQLEETRKAKEKNVKQAEALKKALEGMEKAGKGNSAEAKDLAKQLATLEKEIAKAEKAETELTVKMLKAEAAANKSKKEMQDYGDKLEELEKSGSGVDDVMEDIAESVEDAGEAAEEAGDGFTVFKGALANLAADAVTKGLNLIAEAGKAIASSFKDAVNAADDLKSATNDFSASTGLDTTENPGYKKAIQNVYGDNLGEDYSDIANSMATIKQTTGEIDPTNLEGLTRNALMLRDAFGFEVQEQMRAVDMLMTQFGIDSETAFNLVAQGAQNGLNKNGDLLDTINEYSVHYKQLGYDAEDMFNSLANGAAAGTFSVDKLGDAMKEFGIRAKDGSSGSLEAFATLGLDGEKMTAQFAAGGDKAEAATQKVINTLLNMDDAVAQNAAGVALFGTMWEDLGVDGIKALTNMDGSIASTTDALEQINEVKYDNLKSAMGGLGRIIETNVAVPIGEKALPLISTFVNELSSGFKSADGDVEAMAQTTGNALSEMVNGFAEQIPSIVAAAQQFIPAFIAGIAPSIPTVVAAGGDIVFAILEGILSAMPELAPAAVSIISTLILTLINHLPDVVQAGLTLLLAIIDAIPLFIEQLAPQIPVIVTTIVTSLLAATPQLLEGAVQLLLALVQAIPLIIPGLIAALPQIIDALVLALTQSIPILIDAGIQLFFALVEAIPQFIPALVEALPQIITAIVGGLISAAPELLGAAVELFGALLLAIPTIIASLGKSIPDIIKAIVTGLGKGFKDMVSAGDNLIGGLIKGLLGGLGELRDAVKGIGKKVVNWFEDVFDINSPSRIMRDKIGKMLPPGIGLGVEANADAALKSIRKLGKDIVSNLDVSGISDKLAVIKEGFTGGTMKVAAETTPGKAGGGNTSTTTNHKSVTYAPTFKYNKPLNSKEIYRQNKNMLGKIVGVEE